TQSVPLCTTMWAKAWKRASFLKLVRTWPLWRRKTTRRSALKQLRATGICIQSRPKYRSTWRQRHGGRCAQTGHTDDDAEFFACFWKSTLCTVDFRCRNGLFRSPVIFESCQAPRWMPLYIKLNIRNHSAYLTAIQPQRCMCFALYCGHKSDRFSLSSEC
ncbi:unnamed protein product, partial [Durusdinium trenchii]